MANDVNIISGTGAVYVRYTYSQNWQSTSGQGSSNITVNCYALIRNGTRTGTFDWNAQINGSNGGSITATFSGDYYMGSRTQTIGHDADGNLTIWCGAWIDAYYGSGTAGDNIGFSKIYRSAGWSSSSASAIDTTTATITNTVSDWGIGSSHGHRMYYRKQGSGAGWTATSDEASTNPRSWSITGLEPGTKYEYFGRQWNNNTSAVDGTTYTFDTLPSGMMNIIMDIM